MNGDTEPLKNGRGSRSRSTSKHSEDSRNGSRHRGGRSHEPNTDEEDNHSDPDNERKHQTNGNGDVRYDAAKSDDEDSKIDLNGDGDNIVNADYQSNNEEDD